MQCHPYKTILSLFVLLFLWSAGVDACHGQQNLGVRPFIVKKLWIITGHKDKIVADFDSKQAADKHANKLNVEAKDSLGRYYYQSLARPRADNSNETEPLGEVRGPKKFPKDIADKKKALDEQSKQNKKNFEEMEDELASKIGKWADELLESDDVEERSDIMKEMDKIQRKLEKEVNEIIGASDRIKKGKSELEREADQRETMRLAEAKSQRDAGQREKTRLAESRRKREAEAKNNASRSKSFAGTTWYSKDGKYVYIFRTDGTMLTYHIPSGRNHNDQIYKYKVENNVLYLKYAAKIYRGRKIYRSDVPWQVAGAIDKKGNLQFEYADQH